MISSKVVLPKLRESIYKKISWADVSSAPCNIESVQQHRHVIKPMWPCTGSLVWMLLCLCARNAEPCTCSSWVPWLRAHAHSCPTLSSNDGVGHAWLHALTSVSLCWCLSRDGICCSCLKQRMTEEEGKHLQHVQVGSRVSMGCSTPPACSHHAGVLPQARISFYCEQ